jgi:pimeloyl-ACP methyl ester carboxylesterase
MQRFFSVTAMLGLLGVGSASGLGLAQEPEAQTLTVKGVKIHYVVEGKGEPVVLIHGLYSSADSNWKKTGVIAELAKDHQVIALDLPGHGQSDKPEKEEAYGLQMMEDVIAVLDHLKIQKAHIVGYSLGGMIVAKLLATHPERALSGTLGGMGWFKEGSAQQKFFEQTKGREATKTPTVAVHSMSKLAITEQELKKIQVPVKMIVGERDPVKKLYVAPCQEVRQDWPVAEIADAGHISCIMKKEFREEIGAWVRKQSKQ